MPSLDSPNYSPLTYTVAEVVAKGMEDGEPPMETAAVILDTIIGTAGPGLTAADLDPVVSDD